MVPGLRNPYGPGRSCSGPTSNNVGPSTPQLRRRSCRNCWPSPRPVHNRGPPSMSSFLGAATARPESSGSSTSCCRVARLIPAHPCRRFWHLSPENDVRDHHRPGEPGSKATPRSPSSSTSTGPGWSTPLPCHPVPGASNGSARARPVSRDAGGSWPVSGGILSRQPSSSRRPRRAEEINGRVDPPVGPSICGRVMNPGPDRAVATP